MEQKETKIGFFKRLKKAIFELEDYGFFLGERLTVAFKYFFVLIFAVSLIFSLIITYRVSDAINKAYSYIVNELPDFEFKDNSLNFENKLDAYDDDYHFSLLADTTENLSEETIKEYKNKIYSRSNYGMILLKNEVILIANDSEDITKYADLMMPTGNSGDESTEETTITNKQDLVTLLEEINVASIIFYLFIGVLISVYLLNVFIVLSDVCVVAVFGWFAARICGVNFKINPMIALSIYGLSLSIILDLIFDIIYISTGFSVEYFNVVYLLIAYVYIIAAIFMIKYDLIKHTEELKKIIEVQKQVERDLALGKIEKKQDDVVEEKEDEKEEKKQDEKQSEKEEEKPEENRDPDGSEI